MAAFLCCSVLRTNDNVSVRCFAFGIGGDGVVVLQSQMDDAAFTGSHRFETDLFARAFHLACEASGEGFQGILAALSVVFNVK